jgi:hypothetical protein
MQFLETLRCRLLTRGGILFRVGDVLVDAGRCRQSTVCQSRSRTSSRPTEQGSPLFIGCRTGRDAASVAALREAGAVILGKAVTLLHGSAGVKTTPRIGSSACLASNREEPTYALSRGRATAADGAFEPRTGDLHGITNPRYQAAPPVPASTQRC